MKRFRILVVDDEEDVRTFLTMVFEDAGAEVVTASDGDQAVAMASEHQPDLISLDLSMPGISGMEVLRRLQADGCSADVVVLTAHGSVEAAVSALKAGAMGVGCLIVN